MYIISKCINDIFETFVELFICLDLGHAVRYLISISLDLQHVSFFERLCPNADCVFGDYDTVSPFNLWSKDPILDSCPKNRTLRRAHPPIENWVSDRSDLRPSSGDPGRRCTILILAMRIRPNFVPQPHSEHWATNSSNASKDSPVSNTCASCRHRIGQRS